MPYAKPLAPARRSCRPVTGDTLESIAARELPGLPPEEAQSRLREWNPHLAFGRRNFSYVLVSDIVFLEPAAVSTRQGGF